MTLRFSDDGPAFPNDLVDRMLAGEVVLLCGAGVSAPQLPTFGGLVTQVYERVGVVPTKAESLAIEHWRYEEALGAVARRLVNPQRIHEEVADILASAKADLQHHKTLLRLSRASDNRLLLVTTNFEGLFERALDEVEGIGSGKIWSLAGQALPPPGTDGCHGIVHLHGRIRDAVVGLEVTPLVLTSAEYGDAYMRSGWASRFLFDLVRCKTLVLVGYSANDAPVRYFLNLMEGDRDRFDDLRSVYALDSYQHDAAETEARWDTIAVVPIPYRKRRDDGNAHNALWEDLGQLADLVERPRLARRERAKIFARSFASVTATEREEAEWLLKGKSDLWDVVAATVGDPEWFEYFNASGLWKPDDAPKIIANWCFQALTERKRLETAIHWQSRLGRLFTDGVRLALALQKVPQPWARAWKVLAQMPPKRHDVIMHHFRLAQALEGPIHDDQDLRNAVKAITPQVELKARWWPTGESARQAPKVLRDIVTVSLSLDDPSDMDRVVSAVLQVKGREHRLAELCNGALSDVIAAAVELDIVNSEWDALDGNVPAVEAHDQNQYHDGCVHLCVVLSALIARLTPVDPEYARSLAQSWKRMPGLLGLRMWVNALRLTPLFTADEAASGILELPEKAFWYINRELVLAMRERLGEAQEGAVAKIVSRILRESPSLYQDYPVEGADWRPQAKDYRVWLMLTAIRLAGVLPAEGLAELDAIALRYPFITGDYEEADLFGSYSTGVHSVQGDPAPLIDAEPDDRLRVARTLRNDRDFSSRLSWSTYCAAQPAAAFELLNAAALSNENLDLWNDFLEALTTLTVVRTEVKPDTMGLVRRAFDRLCAAEDDFVAPLLSALSYLLRAYTKVSERYCAGQWWDRLWRLCEQHEEPLAEDDAGRFYDRLINRASGRLAELLLLRFDHRNANGAIAGDDRQRLAVVIGSDTAAGWFGRGACAYNAGFILHTDWRLALGPLRERLSRDDSEGIALRSVLLGGAPLSFAATRAYKRPLFKAAIEAGTTTGHSAVHVASRFLHPLVSWRMSPGTGKPPISTEEVRRLLYSASHTVLAGAAQCMRIYVAQIGHSPERTWRAFVGPIFHAVWPREARFKRASVSSDLAALCVGTGAVFEEAFLSIRHFLTPLDGGGYAVSQLEESSMEGTGAHACLQFLWILLGPGASGRSTELATILDKLVAISPRLEVDRRLQWLEQNRAIRFE
ncbi:SIR2 family protein [Burkholderia cepacia]|uniref:SIR2 family protein n=1 Tax=Burkholderia cepacia TaxID=292 RepID=UPI00157A98D0|nr:SIR2 family protein [Burkholderia cepacia]NTX49108.1 SIR2 family protein [Burkholderia cepacia]